ncbi:hypothetical protein JCM8097_004417 [Rhodosporidiobolus ruineniae]
MSSTHSQQLTYHEPALPALLTLISLLYLLQVARGIANYLLGAGLLGEIALGVIYGPVAGILDVEWERSFIAVGYIGLVLIVFEGGLTLRPSSFLPLLPLALITALLGILLPMAFTFALFSAPTFGYPPLQAFTAGSALASTSLGTTFYVLRAAGPTLGSTRVGEILKGAALIDDVVALVLLSVIQSLGPDPSAVTGLGWTIGRPVVASAAMALLGPGLGRYLFRPMFRMKRVEGWVEKGGKSAELFLAVAVLSAFLAIAYYIGTTMLLGAFLAGVFVMQLPSPTSSINFLDTWEVWLVPLHEHIFVPLFFASIGLSIPFLSLWTGPRIWRGVVYALLMALGKVLAGLPILVVDLFSPPAAGMAAEDGREGRAGVRAEEAVGNTEAERSCATMAVERNELEREKEKEQGRPAKESRLAVLRETSLSAAAFVGLALVARGEIGILVLQVAYSSASVSLSSSSSAILSEDAYLISIWGVALCTILGPVAFSALVRRRGGDIRRGRWGAGRG